jgi:hypothetical protein
MEFKNYNRKPFAIEAVLITEDNISECSELIGELVPAQVGVVEESYIRIDKRIVPNVRRAHIGWFITKMDDNIRCYSPTLFDKQYTLDEECDAVPEPVVTIT